MDYLRDDEYLGRAVIHLKGNNRVLSRGDHIEEPQWFPIKLDNNDDWDEETGAAILCSFQMIRLDTEFKVPFDEIQLNRLHP